jgi:hypothetical protein
MAFGSHPPGSRRERIPPPRAWPEVSLILGVVATLVGVVVSVTTGRSSPDLPWHVAFALVLVIAALVTRCPGGIWSRWAWNRLCC